MTEVVLFLTFYDGQVSIVQLRGLCAGYSVVRRFSRSLLIHPLIPVDELHQQHPPNHKPLPPLALLSPGLFFFLFFPLFFFFSQQMLRKPALDAQSEVAAITSQHICSFPPQGKICLSLACEGSGWF